MRLDTSAISGQIRVYIVHNNVLPGWCFGQRPTQGLES